MYVGVVLRGMMANNVFHRSGDPARFANPLPPSPPGEHKRYPRQVLVFSLHFAEFIPVAFTRNTGDNSRVTEMEEWDEHGTEIRH